METRLKSSRLLSLDALRGFDMFWIIGGETIFHTLSKYTNNPFWNTLSYQFEHAEWEGFRAYDLIFPLFLFIAGVAMPYSLTQRLERGNNKLKLQKHVIIRGLKLVLLGLIFNGLLDFDWDNMRYASVLGRIGLAYLIGGLIVLNTKLRGQIAWFISILMGYWLIMKFYPVPGFGPGDYSLEGNFAGYVDRTILPGKMYFGFYDPEGLFSTIPAIATALLGAITGHFLKNKSSISMYQKGVILFGAGAIFLLVGYIWNFDFPINKNLWSSSFVCITGGWSLILLSLFYLSIDVLKLNKWTFPFVVIGMNSITIYMLQKGIIDFEQITSYFFKGTISWFPYGVQAIVFAIGIIMVKFMLLLLLYRNKIFLKV